MHTLLQWIGRKLVSVFGAERVSFTAIASAVLAIIALPGDLVRAAEIAGVRIETKVRVGGVDLALNGVGLRQRFMVDVYVIGLYFAERTKSPGAAIESVGPKRIALTFMREVTAQSLVEALYEGVRESSTQAEFERLKPYADRLSSVMLPLRIAKKGDIVALDYVPDEGAQVVVNGRNIGLPIPSSDLYRALLRIWIGEMPVDVNLKQLLLTGST
jgi:hypothetical protein